MDEVVRSCPFCAGDIPANVKKCRHCGEWLDGRDTPQAPRKRHAFEGRNVLAALLFALFGVFVGVQFTTGGAALAIGLVAGIATLALCALGARAVNKESGL